MPLPTTNDRLKEVRAAMGLSQKDFSKMLELKQSYYSEVENGKRNPTFRIVSQLVEKHGVNANFLFTGSGNIFLENEGEKSRAISHKLENKNSNKSDITLSGNSVGLDVGYQKNVPTGMSYFQRVNNYLKRDSPEDYKLLRDILLLSNFQDFMKDFERGHLDKFWFVTMKQPIVSNDEKISYKQYRDEFIQTLHELSYIKPALSKLSSAVRQFYSDFRPFDKENLIEDYYEEGEE